MDHVLSRYFKKGELEFSYLETEKKDIKNLKNQMV